MGNIVCPSVVKQQELSIQHMSVNIREAHGGSNAAKEVITPGVWTRKRGRGGDGQSVHLEH